MFRGSNFSVHFLQLSLSERHVSNCMCALAYLSDDALLLPGIRWDGVVDSCSCAWTTRDPPFSTSPIRNGCMEQHPHAETNVKRFVVHRTGVNIM
jgi:hypothetical protein